jgi:hypothetical protein
MGLQTAYNEWWRGVNINIFGFQPNTYFQLMYIWNQNSMHFKSLRWKLITLSEFDSFSTQIRTVHDTKQVNAKGAANIISTNWWLKNPSTAGSNCEAAKTAHFAAIPEQIEIEEEIRWSFLNMITERNGLQRPTWLVKKNSILDNWSCHGQSETLCKTYSSYPRKRSWNNLQNKLSQLYYFIQLNTAHWPAAFGTTSSIA